MIHVVVNTKGGAGKSTAAIQVVAAYLSNLKQGGKVNFVEIDDENKTVTKFANSNIVGQASVISTELIDKFVDDSSFAVDDIVVDVGGNKTATMFLERLKVTGGFIAPSTYYIPLLDGDQDAINADATFKAIREFDTNSRIIYILNRAANKKNKELLERQFIFFFGDEILDIPKVRIDERTFVVALNNADIYKVAGRLQKTIFELAEENYDKEFKELAELYWEDRDNQDVYKRLRIVQKLKDSQRESAIIVHNEYAELFENLDEIFQGA